MKIIHKFALSTVVAAMLLSLAGYTGMSNQGKNTVIGAGKGPWRRPSLRAAAQW